VIAEYATSQWVQNIRGNPEVKVRVRERSFAAHARFLSAESDADLNRQVQQLSREKYGWGDGLVVELIPR
jgi:predicted site-specific integrase-resolvase